MLSPSAASTGFGGAVDEALRPPQKRVELFADDPVARKVHAAAGAYVLLREYGGKRARELGRAVLHQQHLCGQVGRKSDSFQDLIFAYPARRQAPPGAAQAEGPVWLCCVSEKPAADRPAGTGGVTGRSPPSAMRQFHCAVSARSPAGSPPARRRTGARRRRPTGRRRAPTRRRSTDGPRAHACRNAAPSENRARGGRRNVAQRSSAPAIASNAVARTSTLSLAAAKLGQPVRDSKRSADANSGAPHPAQRNAPSRPPTPRASGELVGRLGAAAAQHVVLRRRERGHPLVLGLAHRVRARVLLRGRGRRRRGEGERCPNHCASADSAVGLQRSSEERQEK